MLKYITLPSYTIESRLPICPYCHDTKYIVAEPVYKMIRPLRQIVKCTKCNIYWDMYSYLG